MTGLLKRLSWLSRPHGLLAAHARFFSRFDQKKPLEDYQFVVFDTELTGLDRKRDEIISLGAVKIKNLQIDLGETFHYYIRPERLDHTEATLVHRITPGQLEQAPLLAEVLPKFVSFVGTDLLVGHFVELDLAFLHRATRKILGEAMRNPALDTMLLAKAYKRMELGYYHNRSSSASRFNLTDLSNEFNLPFFEAHDALEDAMQTAYLFLFLAKKLNCGGAITLRDLYQCCRSNTF